MFVVFHNLYMLAMQENDLEKAHMLVEKQRKLANVFNMGAYHEASSKLELATVEKMKIPLLKRWKKCWQALVKSLTLGNPLCTNIWILRKQEKSFWQN
jgi:hypothetical protein